MPEEFQPEVDPAESGQVTEAEGVEAPPAEGAAPEPQYFDLDQYADHLVKVTVDGQQIEVPLRELPQGFSRTADYTRKTQELSAQRQQHQFAVAIAESLAANPAEAIALLQQHYGVNLGAESEEGDDEFVDPLERQVRDQQRWIEAQQQRDADAELAADVAAAQAEFGDEIDPHDAVIFAIQRGWNYPHAIRDAYAALAGRGVVASRAAQQQIAAQQAAADAAALEAKRTAGVVAGGSGGVRSGASDSSGQASTVREAFQMAKRQLGMA